MAIGLIVTEPFGGYDKGARIVHPDLVREINSGENEHNCVRIAIDDAEAAAAVADAVAAKGKAKKAADSAA